MKELFKHIIELTNENSGFLVLLIFITTLVIGWITGLLSYYRKRPKFEIRIIQLSTFGCVIDLKRTYEEYPVHKTAFAIYLEIANVGNAPSSVGKIELGYLLSDLRPKWRTSRVWIEESISKSDFRIKFNGSDFIKVLPFLKQHNEYYNNSVDTYLEIGKSAIGMTYFEDSEAYGNRMPRYNKDLKTTDLIIKIKDAFGGVHKKKFKINLVEPNYTWSFSPYFAQTQYEYFINQDNTITKDEKA